MANGTGSTNGFRVRLQYVTSIVQVVTVLFLIVGFFVTVRLEQARLSALEKVVDGTVTRNEVTEMLKTSNEIHQNLREQINLLRADDVYIKQDLVEMRRQINSVARERNP